jgi:hypothetical protein
LTGPLNSLTRLRANNLAPLIAKNATTGTCAAIRIWKRWAAVPSSAS